MNNQPNKPPISLEDVRRNPALLGKFIKQHESKGDKDLFDSALAEIARTKPEDGPTSR